MRRDRDHANDRLALAGIFWGFAIAAVACGSSGGGGGGTDSGGDGPGEASQGTETGAGFDGAGGGQDAPPSGDDSGPLGDALEEFPDGPYCPPCDPKQICCALTGKCYPAGCGACCM